MPIDIREGLDFSVQHLGAARRRVRDTAHNTKSATQVEKAAKRTLEQTPLMEPAYGAIPGGIYSSHKMTMYLRDVRYHHNLIASKSTKLEQEVLRSGEEHFALLDDIQKTAAALQSFVTEDEIRYTGKYTQVHHNSFVRNVDFGLSFAEYPWGLDWKTELSVLPHQVAKIQPEAGITLPVIHEEAIPFLDVKLLSEAADVGDTKWPVVAQDPRRLMIPGETFRYVVARRRFDSTSRKYTQEATVLTLLVELAGLQYVNSLNIRPASTSVFFMEELSYINDLGKEVTIDATDIEAGRSIHVLFEPVVARYLKIKLVQYAPVEQGHIVLHDNQNYLINEVLSANGWSQQLPAYSEEIDAAVYDFSIEEITASFRTYNSFGIYYGRAIEVANLSGVRVDDQFKMIAISENERLFGKSAYLSAGEGLIERYVGLDLTGANGEQLVNELVPLQDSYPVQKELLPLFGGESRAKLFPDLLVDELLVSASAVLSGSIWEVTLDETIPGLVVDPFTWVTTPDLVLIGPEGHVLNGLATEFLVLTSTHVQVKISGTGATTAITGNSLPGLSVGLVSNLTASPATLPVLVKKESDVLVLGTDYEVSVDAGASWIADWPTLIAAYLRISEFVAGHFRIKILSPDYDSFYWVSYTVEPNQFASESKLVRIINGNLNLEPRASLNQGSAYICYMLRAHDATSYLTPVVLSYDFQLRERNVT